MVGLAQDIGNNIVSSGQAYFGSLLSEESQIQAAASGVYGRRSNPIIKVDHKKRDLVLLKERLRVARLRYGR